MLGLFGLSINKTGFFISSECIIWSLVEVVAVAVSATSGTFPTIAWISLILPNHFLKASSVFFAVYPLEELMRQQQNI